MAAKPRRVAVVGWGGLPWRSRYPDKMYTELAYEATKRALDDAGLTIHDIDSSVHNAYCEVSMRQQIVDGFVNDYLGLRGKPAIRTTEGASSCRCIRVAYSEIASGMSDVVLVVAYMKSTDYIDPETLDRGEGAMWSQQMSTDQVWVGPLTILPMALSVHYLTTHMERFGSPTLEQLAKVSVKNHKNALVNPDAQVKLDVTVEDVLNSRIIAWPNTMYMCCLYGEGGQALILASEERAREITDTPIWITGVGSSTERMTQGMTREEFGRLLTIEQSGKRAYEMAGITNPLKEFDVAEVHDIFTGLEIMQYEELGFCELGEGGRLVDEGVTEKTGELPVNPSGGRTAAGHIGGVSGVYSVGQVALQLKEKAGEMQVPIKAGRGLVATIDGNCAHSDVVILERDR